jgi:hypothetical protein
MVGDTIGKWLNTFREQLASPACSLHTFFRQCREFAVIVQEFNTAAQRAQQHLVLEPSLPDWSSAKLEEFKDEYNAFLRDMEAWSKGIVEYLG